MASADQVLAQRLLAEKLVSPEDLAACLQAQGEAEQAGRRPPLLAQELLRRRLLPAWQLGQKLLELHSGFDGTRQESEAGPAAAAPSVPLKELGRYPVTGLLGQGGMGEVLAVEDAHLGRQIAAKTILGTASSSLKARFIQEARITGRLEHPSIVPVYELGMTDEGQVYYTMKRVQGEELKSALMHKPLFELLQILLKVCDAMAYAHSQGVIHRDLKPANIMVGRFGEVQVMDWGLAKVVGEPDLLVEGNLPAGEPIDEALAGDVLRTAAGTVLGTDAYMSPEQARGEIERLDQRTDVYALGAVLYEMLCGLPPYRGETSEEILIQVIEGELLSPSESVPERAIPRELEAVVFKAMCLAPSKRYDSVPLMRRDIEAYIEGRLLQAVEYNTWQVVRKWAARHKSAAVATVVILLSLIGTVYGIGSQLHEARLQRLRAEASERKAQRKEREARLARDAEQQQRILAQVKEREAVSERREALRARDQGRIERLKAEASEKRAIEALQEAQSQRKLAELQMLQRQAAELVRKAMELYARKGDPGTVTQLLAQAEQVYPDHSGLLRLRGRMALDQQEWSKAKSLLDRALKQDSRDYVTHFLLYRWHAEQGRGNAPRVQKYVLAASRYGTRDSAVGLWGQAKSEYDKAQKLSGSERTQALESGVDFCTQALTKRAGFAWALVTRGLCYKELGSWKKALADQDALVVLTGWSMAYVHRGILYQAMKRYGKALADHDHAIRINRRDAMAYVHRGILHQAMKRYDRALADYDQAIRIDPRMAGAYYNRGILYKAMKRYDRALVDYDQAIRLDPRHARAHVNRGSLHRAMKRPDKALADYNAAIRIAPRIPQAYTNRGTLYAAMKRYDEALADLDKAIRIDPQRASAYNNRGNLYQAMKRLDEALADYDAAIRIDPRLANAYVNRGGVHAEMKRYRLAIADWQRALPLVRGTPWEKRLAEYIRHARSQIK